MYVEEAVSNIALELRRGTLVLLVLSQLREPTYGYSLVKKLEAGGVPMDGNTLYPLLRRLEAQGLLQSQWETDGSKPRKYYALTPLGAEVLAQASALWQDFSRRVTTLLEESK